MPKLRSPLSLLLVVLSIGILFGCASTRPMTTPEMADNFSADDLLGTRGLDQPYAESPEPSLFSSEEMGADFWQSATYTAESVTGNVQIRSDRYSPWRTLKSGETFDDSAILRTGIRSNAKIVLKDGERSEPFEVGSLLNATKMSTIFEELLSPEGLNKYEEFYWVKADNIDPFAPVEVTRDSLKGPTKEKSVFAEVAAALYTRSPQQAGGAGAASGAASAGSGGGTGGGGSSGGGCVGGG